MQIRPKNMAKLKNTPKYVSNHDNRVKKCSQRTLMSKGQKRITKSSQIDTYLHRIRTRLIYPGENIVKEKNTIKMRIVYIFAIHIIKFHPIGNNTPIKIQKKI